MKMMVYNVYIKTWEFQNTSRPWLSGLIKFFKYKFIISDVFHFFLEPVIPKIKDLLYFLGLISALLLNPLNIAYYSVQDLVEQYDFLFFKQYTLLNCDFYCIEWKIEIN